MPQTKIQQPALYTRAMIVPASIVEADRTVDVVFCTDTPVLMSGWDGNYMEILSCETGACDLSRLLAGAPLLNNHDRYSGVQAQFGVTVAASVGNHEGRATLKFSKRADVEPFWQDVKDGIIKGISCGYRVMKYSQAPQEEGQLPIYTAIEWQPFEISLAPIPADINAGVRSRAKGEKEELNDVIIETLNKNKNHAMKQQILDFARSVGFKNDTFLNEISVRDGITLEKAQAEIVAEMTRAAKEAGKEPAKSAPGTPLSAEEVLAADRTRQRLIREAFGSSGIDMSNADNSALMQRCMDEGTSIDATREAILGVLKKSQPPTKSTVSVGEDEKDKERESIISGMIMRSGQAHLFKNDKDFQDRIKSDEKARSVRSLPLIDIAKDSMERGAVDFKNLDKMKLVERSITSSMSDFPILLSGLNRRILLAAYGAVADSWRRFCMTGSVSDFREWKRLRYGSLSRLDALGENGEFKNKPLPDAEQESIQAGTFGNTINVTRKMIVNDDLNGLARLTAMLGRAASRSIEQDVYTLLTSNAGVGPTMADGNPLFHSTHKNIATTAGAASAVIFDAMKVQMAQQMDPSNNDFIDIRPSIWLGPLALESTAKIVNDSLYDPDANSKLQRPNISRGIVTDIVGSPRLTGTPYYMFANPSEEPVIEVAFLDGNEAPFLDSEQSFDVDGMRWKVRMDYGVGAIGWRGVIKNAGV